MSKKKTADGPLKFEPLTKKKAHFFGFGEAFEAGGHVGQKLRQVTAGEARSRQKRYAAWQTWGNDTMIEIKNMIRADPHIKRAEILRRVRDYLNPSCKKRHLERIIDHWMKRAE